MKKTGLPTEVLLMTVRERNFENILKGFASFFFPGFYQYPQLDHRLVTSRSLLHNI